MRAVAALVVLLVSSCSPKIDLSGTSYQCSDGICPSGYACVSGMCTRQTAGIDGGSDADPTLPDGSIDVPDGGEQPAVCGTIANLSDDFDDGDVDWGEFQALRGATISQGSGRVALELPENPAEAPWANLVSDLAYDFRNSSATVEITSMVGSSAYARIRLRAENGVDDVSFTMEEGSLKLTAFVGGSASIDEVTTYNPTNDRWWRIRDSQGTISFDTSPNGQTWVTRLSGPAPAFVASARIEFNAASSAGSTANGSFTFDNFNFGAPSPVWCKATAMSDSFAGKILSPFWRADTSEGCTFTQSDNLSVDAPADVSCPLVTATRYDLTDSQVTLEITQALASNASAAISLFVYASSSSHYIQFDLGGTTLYSFVCDGAGCTPAEYLADYSQQHRWWRIQETGGKVDLSTSPDGANWNSLKNFSTDMDLDDVRIEYRLSSYGDVVTGAFDNYNVGP